MKKLAVMLAVFFFMLGLVPSVWAGEEVSGKPEQVELSLDEAISRALRHSKSLERSALEVDYAEEVLRNAGVALVVYAGPTWATQYVPGVEGPYATYLSADYGYEAAQKKKELEEDTVVADVYAKYYGVLQAGEKVAACRTALASEEKKYAAARARFSVGMLSRKDLDLAAAGLAQRRAELDAAESALDSAYVAFNRLVGLSPEDRPVLTESVVFVPLDVTNLTSEVSGIAGDNPLQWVADEGAELQDRLIGLTGSGEEAEIRADQARLDADITRENTKSAAYNFYYTIKQLEGSYVALKEQVRAAEEALRVARLSYEVGLAIQADVLAAEAALAQARQALFDITCRHELLKMAFYKPWTAGVLLAGTGSGSSALPAGATSGTSLGSSPAPASGSASGGAAVR